MHITYTTRPSFGGKLRTQTYYEGVNLVINSMRPLATLRAIAKHLNTAQFLTPSGLEWNRERLANYLRSTAI